MSKTKSSVVVEPCPFFDGHCDEAIAFYRQVLNAKVVRI